jgi:uncharacterized protein (DUF3820 family)
MNSNRSNIVTLTGYSMAEAFRRLDEELEPAAYAPVPGGPDLTDIKPAWLTAALNEVFGIAGHGWWFDYEQTDLFVEPVVQETRNGERELYRAALDRIEFYYRLVVNEQEQVVGPILANGGSENEKREYAVRGAITNALGAAASKLGWQLSVYQGKRSHATIAEEHPAAVVIPFGKFKGQTLGQVAASEPGYLAWLAENARTDSLRAAAQALLEDGAEPQATPPASPSPPHPQPQPSAPQARPRLGTRPADVEIPFGKFKGQTLGEVIAQERGYVEWLARNARKPVVKTAAQRMLEQVPGTESQETPEAVPSKESLAQALQVQLPFGTRNHPEYKGQTLGELEQRDPQLIRWLADKSKNPALRGAAGAIVAARPQAA